MVGKQGTSVENTAYRLISSNLISTLIILCPPLVSVLGRRPNGHLELSLKNRTILFLLILSKPRRGLGIAAGGVVHQLTPPKWLDQKDPNFEGRIRAGA